MTYIEKYYNFRAKVLNDLLQTLKTKSYNVEEEWNDVNNIDRYNLPCEVIHNDGFYDNYTIVKYEDESFLGLSWENNEDFWFRYYELETQTICQILDIINKQHGT